MVFKEKILLYKIQTKKSSEAYGELYDLYIDKIYRFILFKVAVKEDAEDLTSEVFLKAWNYLVGEEGRKIKSFSGFIYQIARNSLVDYYRNRGKNLSCSLEDLADRVLIENDKNYSKIENKEDIVKVLNVLNKMKESYREIITLYYIEELSIIEISKITGKSLSNVRVTMHRAMKLLNKLLTEGDTDNG